ncbi:Trk system potassium uptake protein TrkH [Peptoniphilus sp. ING2-D1G]|nr:Trk system potassium uptake protein TrkH [Peptoniphilus sp. ING2-D1G]
MIFAVEALFMLPPLILSIAIKDGATSSFLITIIILVLLAVATKFFDTKSLRITPGDGLLTVSTAWIAASLFGALPLYFSNSLPTYIDCLFEIVSGFTTTGATVVVNPEILPDSIILWRSMTHWIGGMGILVFTLILLPKIGTGAYQIFKAESPGPVAGKIEPKMTDTAKKLYKIYIVITIVLFLLLLIGKMTPFDAIVHTFGIVGTGGFSSKAKSIGHYSSYGPYIPIVIGIFMIICGTNFTLHNYLYKGKIKNILKDEEFRAYYAIIFGAVTLIAVDLYINNYGGVGKSILDSFFTVTSVSSTSGFVTADYDLWPSFSKYILFLLMIIGSSAGSTAGGMKVIRVVVVFKLVKREVKRILHPHAVIPIRVNGRVLSEEIISGIYAFTAVYMIIALIAATIISLSGIDFLSSISSALTMLSNVGPAFGATGPTRNFLFFAPFYKLVFCVLMLLGRLEFFTLIALFSIFTKKKNPVAD